MNMPYTPKDVAAHATKAIPPEVFYAVNHALVASWDKRNKASRIELRPLVVEIARMMGITVHQVWQRQRELLDFEEAYTLAGWIVKYNQPSYDESCEPYWVFTQVGR